MQRLMWHSTLCGLLMIARAAQAEAPVRILELAVPAGRIHSVMVLHHKGDRASDILLLTDRRTADGTAEKTCHVFPASLTAPTYKPVPAYTRSLPRDAALLATGDVNGDGRSDLTYLTRTGVFAYLGTREGLAIAATPILSQEILVPPAANRLAPSQYLTDLTGDGRADLLLPVPAGLSLHTQQPGGTFSNTPSATLRFPVVSRLYGGLEQTWVTYRLPRLLLDDFDGNGLRDVAAMDMTGCYRFLQRPNGSFDAEMLAPDLAPDSDNSFTVGFFGDWNADRQPDAAFTRMEQRRGVNSTLQVYLGTEGGRLPQNPTTLFDAPSTIMMPVFLDATGDGKSELLLYRVHFGLRFAINYFLRDRISVEVAVHRLGPNGGYASKPAVRYRISVAAFDTGAEPVRTTLDLNGDGAMDLVVGLEPGILGAFLGNPETILPSRPSWTVPVEAYGRATAVELNGDARDDLIITYPEPERHRRASVVLSQGNLVPPPVALIGFDRQSRE